MATQPGVLTDWPWHKLGNAKVLFLSHAQSARSVFRKGGVSEFCPGLPV